MKKCKSCQQEIDEKAKKCPHCRTDQRGWFKRHPILTALLILIIIGSIGSATGGNAGTTNTTQQSNSASTKAKAEEPVVQNKPEEKIAIVGESVTEGDIAFTVESVNKVKKLGNSLTQKSAQGIFYVVTVKLENVGKKTVTFDSSMAKIIDSEGREYERSIDGQTAKGMSEGKVDLFLQQIQPSLSYTGDLVFDLPETIKDPVLVVKGSIFSNGAKIKLN